MEDVQHIYVMVVLGLRVGLGVEEHRMTLQTGLERMV